MISKTSKRPFIDVERAFFCLAPVFSDKKPKKYLTNSSILYILYIYTVYTEYTEGEVIILDIIISNTSGKPIYEQIYSQIKNQIISGRLKEGDMLPSIRALAKDLRISVITTKRAYEELEKEGFIYTVASKGCFIARKNMDLIKEENLKKIEEHMEAIAQLAAALGLSKKELVEMFWLVNEEEV